MSYYKGNLRVDAESAHAGWVVGEFMEDKFRNTKDVEIKYWEFPVGKTDHAAKTSTAIEITIVLEGEIRGVVAGESTVIGAGEYIVMQPNTPNNIVHTIAASARGITIKAPSNVNNKTLLETE